MQYSARPRTKSLRYATPILAALAGAFNGSAALAEQCITSEEPVQSGKISYYADKFHGRKTASGEIFDMYAMTAASKTFPFGTRLLVRVGDNEVIVEVTDRGPYVGDRKLDISKGAAEKAKMINEGVADAEIYRCAGTKLAVQKSPIPKPRPQPEENIQDAALNAKAPRLVR